MKKTNKTKKAFVLMPFKEPYNSYYAAIYKPALEEAAYNVTRADDLFVPRPIMLDIQQSIYEADIILCEMSERNPNVFYELGLAHAIGKPAILVARKEDDIPFDLRHIRTVIYDVSSLDWKKKLKKAIVLAAMSIMESNGVWPPPLAPSSSPIGPLKRKVAVFAEGEFDGLKDLLVGSGLFQGSDVYKVDKDSIEKTAGMTLFLMHWKSFETEIEKILAIKDDSTALIIYAPPNEGFIDKQIMERINQERNVILVNFRGRLLNDIVVSMIATGNMAK